jgi:hypothetical protein
VVAPDIDQLGCCLHDGRLGWSRARDPNAAAAPKLEYTVVAELAVGGEDGVAVDGQRFREFGRRREVVAGAKLAMRDRASHAVGDLLT